MTFDIPKDKFHPAMFVAITEETLATLPLDEVAFVNVDRKIVYWLPARFSEFRREAYEYFEQELNQQ